MENFGQACACTDEQQPAARVQPAASNVFSYNTNGGLPDTLDPQYTNPATQYGQIQTLNPVRRCRVAAPRPPPTARTRSSTTGCSGPADCNASDIPPGRPRGSRSQSPGWSR